MIYVSARSRRFNRAFVCVLALVFAITVLKGFRPPNLYSATTFALNYSQGFVRRGLVGEVMRQVFGELAHSYWFFAGFALLILTAVGVALGVIIRRALRAEPRDFGFRCVLLAFAASPGLVFFVHTVGYFDHIGFLALLLLILWASRTQHRFAVFYVVAIGGLILALVHEVLTPMFGLVTFFAMLCHILRRAPDTPAFVPRAAMVAHAVAAILLLFASSTAVSLIGPEHTRRVFALQGSIATEVDYWLRPDVFEALRVSTQHSLLFMMPAYWSMAWHRPLALKSALSVLPSFGFMFFYGLYSIRRLELAKSSRWVLGVAFAGASLGPLCLNLVGWDWNRWNCIVVLACFACILTLKLFLRSPPRRTSLPLVVAGVAAAVISLASDTVLFDERRVQFYPFENQVLFIQKVIADGFRYRPSD